MPEPFRELLKAGVSSCSGEDFIFTGRTRGRPLSTRMVEIIVRKACRAAGIGRPVSVMTLRHSYAIRRLENGVDLRVLQHELVGTEGLGTEGQPLRMEFTSGG